MNYINVKKLTKDQIDNLNVKLINYTKQIKIMYK